MSRIIINRTLNRNYEISLYGDSVIFEGDFYHFDGGDIYPAPNSRIALKASDYLGIGRIKYSSAKRYFRSIYVGVFLLAAGALVNFIKSIIKKASFIGIDIDFPLPITIIYYLLLIICAYMIFKYLRSKRKLIEISFVGNRICVPKESLTDGEISFLQQEIINLRRG